MFSGSDTGGKTDAKMSTKNGWLNDCCMNCRNTCANCEETCGAGNKKPGMNCQVPGIYCVEWAINGSRLFYFKPKGISACMSIAVNAL